MPGPAGVPRDAIIALLRGGFSDRYIGRVLRTNPKRAGRIRREEGIPIIADRQRSTLTPEQRWATFTQPADDGHLLWIGPYREGVPSFQHHRQTVYARRIAFGMAHERPPVGQVRSGCGRTDCVAPTHVEDQQLRDQYRNIFGGAA